MFSSLGNSSSKFHLLLQAFRILPLVGDDSSFRRKLNLRNLSTLSKSLTVILFLELFQRTKSSICVRRSPLVFVDSRLSSISCPNLNLIAILSPNFDVYGCFLCSTSLVVSVFCPTSFAVSFCMTSLKLFPSYISQR